MSQNPEQKENAPKKKFPFFSLLIALFAVAGVIAAAYFAIFPNQKIEIPFVSEKTKEQINSFVTNPSTIFQPDSGNETETKTGGDTEPARSNYQTANEIFEKLTAADQKAQTAAQENTEQNLNVVDMTPKSKSTQPEETDTDGFSLQPPDSVNPLESGRRMLTEEEIRQAQERDRQEKLAKLEALRGKNTELTDEEQSALPSRRGTLSSLVPDANFDPVVTLFFIQDLAEYLVDNYKIHTDGQGYAAVTMPKINRRYGTGLYGLEHAKGRLGVLEYAYNASMIPVLYSHLSPLLIKAMQQTAEQKNMPPHAIQSMFKSYADLCFLYARAIRELNAIPQLAENIQNLRALENGLKEEEKYFAENLLGFEQNRENKTIARTYEENIKQSTIRTEQLRSRLNNARNDLKQYLAKYDQNLAEVPDILELALWLQRRNNPGADLAFADALEQFSHDVSILSYE